YNDRTSTLIVKNTPENIEILEKILPAFIEIPKQIEIEAKFVEISQTDLDELGFNWKVGSHELGSFRTEGGSPGTTFPSPTTANPDNHDQVTGGLRDSGSLSLSAIDSILAGATGGGIGGLNQIGTIKGILTEPR